MQQKPCIFYTFDVFLSVKYGKSPPFTRLFRCTKKYSSRKKFEKIKTFSIFITKILQIFL